MRREIDRFDGRDRELPQPAPERESQELPSEREGLERAPEVDREKAELARLLDRERVRELRPSAAKTLAEVSVFRAVDERDLLVHRYGGGRVQLRRDLRLLQSKGLVERHALSLEDGSRLKIWTATRDGSKLARAAAADPGQRFYSGLAKPREAAHDAKLYAVFQKERAEIDALGGRIVRVTLDHELKQRVASAANWSQNRGQVAFREARRQAAEAEKLPFRDGKVSFSDLRIEYESAGGGREHRDIEFASDRYKKSQVESKAEAGFRVYRDSIGGGRRIEPELLRDALPR